MVATLYHFSRPPTQSPINPPYKDAVGLKKQDQLAKAGSEPLTGLESLKLDSSSHY